MFSLQTHSVTFISAVPRMQSSSQQHDTLLRRRAPNQLLKPQTSGPAIILPSSHSWGPTRRSAPLSSAYIKPFSQSFSNSPCVPPQRPQCQPSSSSGYFHTVKPQNAFIAVDPFQVSHWKQLDASLDQLTFDNIQVSTGSAPGPKVIVACPFHLGGNLPNNKSSYGQNHSSTQSNISSVPASHIYGDTRASPINLPSTSCSPKEAPSNRENASHSSSSGISYPLQPPELPNKSFLSRFTKVVRKFVLITFPTQIYLHILLRLPSLYFSRVAQIFEDADRTLPEIKKMALDMASQGLNDSDIDMAFESSSVPPAYRRLTSVWEFFIGSLMREWETFNIISVLLLTFVNSSYTRSRPDPSIYSYRAILTILQIQSAAEDPLTRYTALISLMCALISLLFGCMYIIRFGSMRKTYKAADWAVVSPYFHSHSTYSHGQ